MEIQNLLNGVKLNISKVIESQPQQFRFGVSCPNLAPLSKDTVSFKGTNEIEETKSKKVPKKIFKKSDFEGIDLVVVERFKPNIQQFKSKDDLQEFAKKEVEKIQEKDFGGRQEETVAQRKAMLKEWFDYVTNENDAYSNTQRLIILNAITKQLKPNTDDIPEVLNKGVLAQTVADLETRLKANPKENFDFNKMYKTNLRAHFAEDTDTGETMTGWAVIPSKQNDPENFESNVEKLKTLSHKNWCTKSFNAEPYLEQGDFHVYLKNGQPKLGVRFEGKKVVEIQGEKNDSKIPIKYFEVLEEHVKENKIKLSTGIQSQFENAKPLLKEFHRIKEEFGDVVKLKTIDDVVQVLNYFGIRHKQSDEGLELFEYKQPDNGLTYSDLDIDENKLFNYVTKIEKNANFAHSALTNLGNLKTIVGSANFRGSKITDLGALEAIGKNADFAFSNVKTLGGLKTIGGNATFGESALEDLGSLEYIGGRADFDGSKIEDLGNLIEIGGNALFRSWYLSSLGKLERIGGDACFAGGEVTDLGNLEVIGGNVKFVNSNITNLKNLQRIGRDADFSYSDISDLGKLTYVGGSANFANSKVKDLKNLKAIMEDADFRYTDISDLNGLEYVGGTIEYDDGLYEEVQELEARSVDNEDRYEYGFNDFEEEEKDFY